MKALSQFVVHLFDLIESEGRCALGVARVEGARGRRSAIRMLGGVAVLLIAVPLCVTGLWLMAAGLMWWLETEVTRPLAATLTGLFVLGAGAGGVLCFWLIAGRTPGRE